MSSDIKSLVLLMTLQCPLECDHCIVDSSPRNLDKLDYDQMLEIIKAGERLGVKSIGFTGGDPMISPKVVTGLHKYSRSLGLKTIMITSAFFASTEKHSKKLLAPLKDLHMLGISTDGYHQDFTDISRVRNAISAAIDLRINRIEVQVAHLGQPEQVESVRNYLSDYTKYITIVEQIVWPVGRAKKLINKGNKALIPIEDINLDCPMIGPVVTPDQCVHACCSSLLNLKEKDPLILGKLDKESLDQIWRKTKNNAYYNTIKSNGLRPLLLLLKTGGYSNQLESHYTDVCHLCYEIQRNSSMVKFLTSTIDILNPTTATEKNNEDYL